MAKGTAFAATFALLFAVGAVAYEFDLNCFIPEYLNSKSCGCESQLLKHPMDCCQFYLREGSRVSPPPPPPQSTSMVVDQASSWRDAFPKCCEQLEDVSKKCRCEVINQVFQQQMQTGQLQGIETQEMLLTAQSLPVLCRLKKAHPCNITTPTPTPAAAAGSGSGSGSGSESATGSSS